jgi:hypothetical protein
MKKLLILSVVAVVCSSAGSARAQVTAEEFNKLKDRIEALEKAGKAQADDLADIKVRLGKLAADMGTVVERVVDADNKVKDLLKQDAKGVVDLLGNMERSAAFRADVEKLTSGRLVIENNTGLDQYLYVNGSLWRVIPGKSFAPVNRGVVTVQRPGSGAEVLNDWQFNAARGYFVAYRYPTSVVTLSPVIYWPY